MMTNTVGTTPIDLQRDFGRMEGSMAAMQRDMTEIKDVLKAIDERLAKIENSNAERKGAWWTLAGMATVIGTTASVVIGHFWK